MRTHLNTLFVTRENVYLRKDGAVVWARLSVALKRDDEGRPRYDISVVEDPALAPGDARISGPWVEADLTMQAAVDAVREALT